MNTKLAFKIILSIVLAVTCSIGCAQDKEPSDSTVLLINNPETNTVDTVYTIVDEKPEYPGGFEEMFRQVCVRYPIEVVEAINQPIEGVVIVQFVINERGEIGNMSIAQSLHPKFDAEAIKGVKKGLTKKFKPAKKQGKAVKYLGKYAIKFHMF